LKDQPRKEVRVKSLEVEQRMHTARPRSQKVVGSAGELSSGTREGDRSGGADGPFAVGDRGKRHIKKWGE